MRTDLSGAELTLLETGSYDEHWRLKVANGSGTLKDISTRLKAGSIHVPDPDGPIGTAEITLLRELNDDTTDSLSPLVASSYNVLDDGITASPLLQVGRAATLEIACVSRGSGRPADGSALWHEVIGGYLKQPHWPQRYGDVRLEIHDRAYKLERTFIESPNVYLKATAIEDVIQTILDDVMGSGAYTLVVDGSGSPSTETGSALSQDYRPEIKPVWEACQDLAASIGWVLWYRYDASGDAQLTLTEPRRSKSSSDYDFSTDQISDVTALTIIEEDIRNVVDVYYINADGGQESESAENTTSIAKYGGIRRYMRLSEDLSSPVRTQAAASALVTAALSDLQDPDADQEIETIGAWWPGEPSVDLYGFGANTYIYDSDQTYAPYSIGISFQQGSLSKATIRARGKPSAGSGVWIKHHSGTRDPVQEANAGTLYDFQFLEDTPSTGKVTVSWTRGGDVTDVWYYNRTVTLPITTAKAPWPADGDAPDGVLPSGTDSLVLDTPSAGSVVCLQLEPRDSNGTPFTVYRFQLAPKAVSTGSDLPDGSVDATRLVASAQTYGLDCTFTATAADAVSWSSGTLKLASGTTYSISSGSKSSIAGTVFVYFDAAVSTTEIQTTTDWLATLGDNAVFLGEFWPGTVLATVVMGVGKLYLDGSVLHPASVYANQIAANTITGAEIASLSLSTKTLAGGVATGYSSGIGLWAGLDSGTYKFRVGDPSGNYIQWDGSTLKVNGEIESSSFTTTEAHFGGDIIVAFNGAPAPGTYPAHALYYRDHLTYAETTLSDSYTCGLEVLASGSFGILRMTADKGIIIAESGQDLAFFDGTPTSKPTVSGSRGGNAALASLLTALDGLGLLTDSSS